MATESSERLEDVFEEVIRKFRSTEEFFQFARSKNGLKLDQHAIVTICEDNRFSVAEQKLEALNLWRQNQGPAASPTLIWERVGKYFESQTASDALGTNMEEPQQTQVPAEGAQIRFTQNKCNSSGKETISITNITGPTGHVFLGNEQVSLGGAAGPQGDAALDPDVPPLKSSATVSITEKTLVTVGDCFVKFSPHTVREETTVELLYALDSGPHPEGRTPVTSLLSCAPLFQGQKSVKLELPTFCSTAKSVDAGIFTRDQEGNWQELERPIFTQENHFELHYRNLDNLAAFVATDRLGDIWFKISCFLYNDGDGKFAMAFCLNDKAIENMFLYRLTKNKYVRTIEKIEPISALLGDEIHFRITPGQRMQNTKFVVDEKFVSSYQGHVSYCTIDKDAANPRYFITHKRQGRIDKEEAYYIHGRDPVKEIETEFSSGSTSVEFRGKIKADNFLGQVENADIDMRKMGHEDDDDSQPFWKENKLSYEQQMQKRDDVLRKKDEILRRHGRGHEVNSSRRGKRGNTSVVFHGDVEAKTVITGAKNVRIDQRQMRGKKPQRGDKTVIERVVDAKQEEGDVTVENPGSAEGVAVEHSEQPAADVRAEPFSTDFEQKPEIPGAVAEQHSEQPVVDDKAFPIWRNCENQTGEGVGGGPSGQGTVAEGSQNHHRQRRNGPEEGAAGGQRAQGGAVAGPRWRGREEPWTEEEVPPMNPVDPALNPLVPQHQNTRPGQEKRYDNLHLILACCLGLCLLCLVYGWQSG